MTLSDEKKLHNKRIQQILLCNRHYPLEQNGILSSQTRDVSIKGERTKDVSVPSLIVFVGEYPENIE